ncbi:MAG: type transport system ATP-binding protein [Actinomycetota bacterium]|nr:type transport system ATP-binding protein [Actinomycetota bacterium]
MPGAKAYEVRSLVKRYDEPSVLANDRIDFSVESGEAFGLLGPNGAGKTTLVRQLVGLLEPTAGEIYLFGEKLGSKRSGDKRISRTVAYLPQGTLALGEMKVAEAVRWTGMLRGLARTQATSAAEGLMASLELDGLVDRQIRKLSGGEKRLVQLAMTLVGRLPVLILDEPTADIAVELRHKIWDLIAARCREGATVILVTHDVAEAEHALSRVAILDQGRVVAEGTPAALKADLAHRTRIEVVVSESAAGATEAIAADAGGDARVRGRHISIWVPADEAIATLEKLVASQGSEAFEDLRLITPTLEDVYLEVGGRSMTEAEDAS